MNFEKILSSLLSIKVRFQRCEPINTKFCQVLSIVSIVGSKVEVSEHYPRFIDAIFGYSLGSKQEAHNLFSCWLLIPIE